VAAWNEQKRRDHLGQFGFRGDRVFEPVAQFSGGERARLSLAILVARRPNLLLLDEPTNHLDFEMRESLLLAIQEFGGAVVTVSHDRALLRGVCDEFLLVGDGGVTAFDGDLEDYASWLGRRQASAATTEPADTAAIAGAANRPGGGRRESGSEARRRSANARQKLAPLRRELQQAEEELATLGVRRQALEARLADPDFYSTASAVEQREAAVEHARLGERIDAAETRWLELTAELEAAALSEA
jgi:ATP-binding cassette, subfamily F, member 3